MASMLKNKYMPLSEADVSPTRVRSFDGQHIQLFEDAAACPRFALGNYLGSGIAGVVYEAQDRRQQRPVAVKILNPVGYKLTAASSLRRAEVVKPGVPVLHPRGLTLANVYWLKLPRRRELLAGYVSGSPPELRELSLEMCVALWQWEPSLAPGTDEEPQAAASGGSSNSQEEEEETAVPRVPAKYRAFLTARRSIFREIAHMHQLTGNCVSGARIGGGHENVLQLYDVLELVQPSKSTIFLILELAHGGELFDRIRGDAGVEEHVARSYFAQLLAGVRYCHQLGIVHRDLKPENLLLSDADVLKIADFGLSAHFVAAVSSGAGLEEPQLALEDEQDGQEGGRANVLAPARCRRLNSLVGSPHYVAPEVLQNARYGYDGRKADMWSSGVILYGLLVGTLPFGRDLATCPRYLKFGEWLRALPCDPHSGKLLFDVANFQIGGSSSAQPQPQHAELLPSFHAAPPMLGLLLNGSNLLWNQNQTTGSGSSCSSAASGKAGGEPVPVRRSPVAFPTWFFPSTLSPDAVFLLASLLHPDPSKRLSCEDACKSRWVLGRV
ncbi:hypothetical protein BBJ28_00003439 [Nothophytophthora sp. Chile5]|nr:hypothetical protein BBJ28_00003439 [Nothophytophthora sp. Chile5]